MSSNNITHVTQTDFHGIFIEIIIFSDEIFLWGRTRTFPSNTTCPSASPIINYSTANIPSEIQSFRRKLIYQEPAGVNPFQSPKGK